MRKFMLITMLVFLHVLLIMASCQSSINDQKEYLTQETQISNHPRILLSKDKEENLRKIIDSDSVWNLIHRVIIYESDKILEKPPVEYELEGVRLLNKAISFRKRVFYLSYAWRMTGDKKYLIRAEEELLAVSSFKDWNPSHFLDVAEITMGMAIGYDWLYHDLSGSSLTIIKDAIIKKGLEPSLDSDNNWWLTSDSNWNQVCNAGVTYGALAIFDEEPELARKIVNRAIGSIQLPMKAYEPDGAYSEGYSYWAYGTTFNVYFIDAIEKALGSDFGLVKNSAFSKTAGYLTNVVGPTGLNFNYSDGYSEGLINPAMFWFASRENNNSLLYSEKIFLSNGEKIFGPDLPALMIWGSHVNTDSITEPKELIWVGQGKNPVALMRNSWKSDAIFVGLKGGSASNGHAHMDIGSFVMDALGERWAMDFGPQEYNSLESKGVDLWSLEQNSQRWQVFRYNNLAHSTLSFNKEFQLVAGYAPIMYHTAQEMFLSATADLTEIYKKNVSKAIRGVAIVDGKYVAIRDEVELSDISSSIRWSMVTSASVKIINGTTAELTQHDKRILLKVIEPANSTLTTWSTQPLQDYDAENPGTTLLGFEMEKPAKSKVFFTVLLIPQNSEKKIIEKKLPPLIEWKNVKKLP